MSFFSGVGYQPWLKENPDSTLIKFNLQDENSWKPYVEKLDDYLAKYSVGFFSIFTFTLPMYSI